MTTVTPLRQRMLEDLQLRGLSAKTQDAYLRAVRQLAEQHQLNASPPSVRLALARLEIRWKRPRHQLALRAETWRQAKGG